MENVELKFSDDALSSIAKKTMSYATGARGLRSVIESILLDTMFEIPSTKGVTEVAISGEVVEGDAKPLYIYADDKKKKKNLQVNFFYLGLDKTRINTNIYNELKITILFLIESFDNKL